MGAEQQRPSFLAGPEKRAAVAGCLADTSVWSLEFDLACDEQDRVGARGGLLPPRSACAIRRKRDAVTVVDRGRAIATGRPDELKTMIGGDRVDVVLRRADDLAGAVEVITAATGGRPEVDRGARRVRTLVDDPTGALVRVLRALDAEGLPIEDVGLHRPTLDDVFLQLTGHPAEGRSDLAETATEEVPV